MEKLTHSSGWSIKLKVRGFLFMAKRMRLTADKLHLWISGTVDFFIFSNCWKYWLFDEKNLEFINSRLKMKIIRTYLGWIGSITNSIDLSSNTTGTLKSLFLRNRFNFQNINPSNVIKRSTIEIHYNAEKIITIDWKSWIKLTSFSLFRYQSRI